jgi:hypothetical protein
LKHPKAVGFIANGVAVAKKGVGFLQGKLRRLFPFRITFRLHQQVRTPRHQDHRMEIRQGSQIPATLDRARMNQRRLQFP